MRDLDEAEEAAFRAALLRIAGKAAEGKTLPARMKLAESGSPELRRRLAFRLGIEIQEASDGSIRGRFPETRRSPEAWMELARSLGATETVAAKEAARRLAERRADAAFKRAAILAPALAGPVRDLAGNESVIRFVRQDDDSAAAFVRLVRGAAERATATEPITLSQLGSDWFGDSKRLRSGNLRSLLQIVLRAVEDAGEDVSEDAVFARFGIEENPYTSHVVVFVPFIYYSPDERDGGERRFDHPWKLFNGGEACVLPLETVRRIRRVEILSPRFGRDCERIVTSENAAPFKGLVSNSVPALYTEGYPNFAVQRLLRLFAEAGLRADHAGDGDLDGYRIADLVAECIPVDRIVADEVRSGGLPRRPLSDSQQTRLRSWLASHAESPHAAALKEALALGWLEQESFPLPPVSTGRDFPLTRTGTSV